MTVIVTDALRSYLAVPVGPDQEREPVFTVTSPVPTPDLVTVRVNWLGLNVISTVWAFVTFDIS
jgi:hypothetical protein